jgi:hypothetical protein
VAFNEIQSSADDPLTFGWQFRPVLGRRSVSSGMRQLFAVVSLAKEDLDDVASGAAEVVADVQTYWLKYDATTQTTTSTSQVPFWSRAWYNASLRTTLSPYPARGNRIPIRMTTLVPSTSGYQQSLRPVVTKVSWSEVGGGQSAVVVEGRNFFTGTQVIAGGKVLTTPSEGLVIKSEKSIELRLPTDARANDIVVSGRYGASVALRDPLVPGLLGNGCQLQLSGINFQRALAGAVPLTIGLTKFCAVAPAFLAVADLNLSEIPPLLMVGSKVFSGPFSFRQDGAAVALEVTVPEDVFKQAKGLITLRFPFRGPDWSPSGRIYDPEDSFSVTRLTLPASEKGALLHIEKRDGWYEPALTWTAIIGGRAVPVVTPCPPTITAFCRTSTTSQSAYFIRDQALTTDATTIVVTDPFGSSIRIQVPAAKPTPPKPTVTAAAQAVKQNDSVWLTYKGENTTELGKPSANGVPLDWRPAKAGAEVEVQLTREVTSKSGDVEIVFVDKSGSQVARTKVSIGCTSCAADGKTR